MLSKALLLFAVQGASQTTLKPPSATLAEEFSQVVTVRELSDGRLLIGDGRETRVVVADFAAQTVEQVGRVGSGPGEYRAVRPLIRLGGDSSLMVELVSRRWLVFDGARTGGLVRTDAPGYRATNGMIVGADTRGFLLSELQEYVGALRPEGMTQDSLSLLLVHAGSGVGDTVVRLRSTPTRMRASASAQGTITSFSRTTPVLASGEAALLHGDGWISIARLGPYRVDWRAPDSVWVRGAPLPFREIAFDSREREAFLDRQFESTGRASRLPPDFPWAATIPPFEREPLFAAPDGNVLVARTPTADQPERRYDVVDRRGRLVTQIVMSASERVVGFGRQTVYTVRVRDDGIELLRRHPWP